MAVIDKKKIGRAIQAIVHIGVHGKYLFENDLAQEDLGKKIISMPEVEECFMVTGESDMILLVSAKDMDELNDFITNKLRKVGGVEKTVTSVVMKSISNH